MQRKNFTGSESKEAKGTSKPENLVPFGDVVGCLAIHVKNCSHFTSNIDLQHDFCIRISINNIVKFTKTCSLQSQNMPFMNSEEKSMIKFDEVKYFSVQVPRRQNDARNKIYLDLVQYDNKEKQTLLGRVQVHLYEVIQKGCFTEEFQMMNEKRFVCRMEVDFKFSYGNFGYGFSHQLKPLQKIVEPPMFMNIAPPPERTDPVTNVIIPQSIEYPAFLSPDLKVTIGMPPPVAQPTPVRLEKLLQQPRERLEKMKKEYRDLPTWREKATYLEGILNPKLEPNKLKGSTTREVPESQLEKKPEDTSDIGYINKEVETIPTELLGNDDKKGKTLQTLNKQDRDHPREFAPKKDEPAKQRTAPLFTIPNLTITEGNKMVPLEEHYEPATDRKLRKPSHLKEKVLTKYPSILKPEASTSESSYSFNTLDEYIKLPGFIHELMQDKNCGWLNTNKKGKTVAFFQKQYMVATLRPEFSESKPKYQNLNTKDDFYPFLRPINNKISASKRNYEDMSKYRNTPSTEVIEHEDQDPPDSTHSKPSSPTDTNQPNGLGSSIVDTKKRLSPTHTNQPNGLGTSIVDTKQRSSPTHANQPNGLGTSIVDTKQRSSPTHANQPNGLDSSIVDTKKRLSPIDANQPNGLGSSIVDTKKRLSPTHTNQPNGLGSSIVDTKQRSSPTQTNQPNGLGSSIVDTKKRSSPTHTNQPNGLGASIVDTKQRSSPTHANQPNGLGTSIVDTKKQLSPTHTNKPNGLGSSIVDTKKQSSPTHTNQPNGLGSSIVDTKQRSSPTQTNQPNGLGSSIVDTKKQLSPTHTNQPNGLGASIVDTKQRSSPTHANQPNGLGTSIVDTKQRSSPTQTNQPNGLGSSIVDTKKQLSPTHTNQPNGLGASIVDTKQRSSPTHANQPNGLGTSIVDTKQRSSPTHANQPNGLGASIVDTKQRSSPTHTNQPNGLGSSIVDTKKQLAPDPDTITKQTLSSKNNLDCDPTIITIKSLDIKNHLKERLPAVSLPNFIKESSSTESIDMNINRLSKSLSFTDLPLSLQQTVVLCPNLSKNLEDLLDKIFSKSNIPNDTEERETSPSSPLPRVHDKPPRSLEDKILEKIQDLNSWLSKGDILNSGSPVNPNIKDIPGLSFLDVPGNSLEIDRGLVSENHLKDSEMAFPIKKKSSVKKKHLESEVLCTEADFSSIAHDYIIKQIFTAPFLSKLAMGVEELSETQLSWQNQLPTSWESLYSNIQCHNEENDDGEELSEAKSVESQIIEAFPVDTLLGTGLIKVVELDDGGQKSSLLHTETAFDGEKPKDSTEDYLEIKSKTDFLAKQNISIIPKETTSFLNRAIFIDKGQNTSTQHRKYQSTPDENTDLPSNGQRLDREESDLNSILESLNNLLMGQLNESNVMMLKSFFKNKFNVFLEQNKSEKRRQSEKELDRLMQPLFLNNAEDPEEIKENFGEADKLDQKPNLNPELGAFLETLSESEIKKFKSELSKHIQHYLIERLSESGDITKEDLPQIYQNLYLMNEKTEPKGQSVSLEKSSEIIKESVSFVDNFNNHFIDKHLEIKLRPVLNEILQNYFQKNLSESSLFKETETEPRHSNVSSLHSKSSSISFHELEQDTSKGNSGRKLEVNMKYPIDKSLQNYLKALSENELLNLKADLSKYLQILVIDKLSKSGLITERQLKGISNHVNLIQSSSTPLKCIKPDLSFRDENKFMCEDSEKQNKYPEVAHQTTLQKSPEDRIVETELTKKDENEYFPLQDIKENPAIISEQKTMTLVKVQPSSNKNTQAIPSKKSSERLTDMVLKKQRKAHGFMQLPEAETFDFKTEIQNPHSWNDQSEITQSDTCYESTLKMKSLEQKEDSVYKLMVQETHEMLPPNPRIPYCTMPNEDEECIGKCTFSPRQSNTLTDFSSEAGNNHCQSQKGYNNNNKKEHLETLAHYEKEIQSLYIKPSEICNENSAKVLESVKYKVVGAEKNSKPSLFPKVLKRENLKPKVRKERDRVDQQTKPPKTVKILASTPPARRRPRPRKSVRRTLLHWTARRTIHDCSDRFEDFPMTPFQHLESMKSRQKLSEKKPDESHDRLKHARPCTAPEVNKYQESYTKKFTSFSRLSSLK